jgi:hypothetical protein
MGKDAQQIRARLPGGDDVGRLQYEPPKLIFCGRERHAWPSAGLAVRADGPDLVLPDGARFTLGDKQAANWAHAILNPPSRLAKLGVKAGMRVAIDGVDDDEFTAELANVTAPVAGDDIDLLFYAADTAEALAALPRLIPRLSGKGAIWVVSLKGKAAAVKDVEVIGAGRAAGLVDSKVCAFSPTHTALRFTRRK